MLGKCLWKLHVREDRQEPRTERPTVEKVISAFEKAIETVPKPRDTRAEPIIEPHYKLVSVAYKLVRYGRMTPQAAANLLQSQPFAIRKGEPVEITTPESWKAFILESIRHIRHADKSNWHHRMIARVAHIVFDEDNHTFEQASEARAELKDSMFTRTMVLNVWKPEYERPGRHCVYTERYARFMIKLLGMLDDRANIELFAKRVRKKQADFYHFNEVWTECCITYCRLIRKDGNVEPLHEELIRSYSQDDINTLAQALTEWLRVPGNTHPAYQYLSEASELNKLNNKLMNVKPSPIEELISDCWATIFMDVAVKLPRPAQPTPSQPTPSAMTVVPVTESRQQGPMSLNNLVSNMDGALEAQPQTALQPHSQSQLQIQAPESAPPRLKIKPATKRDILRVAEATLAKPADTPRPIASAANRPRVSDSGAANGSKSRSPAAAGAAPASDGPIVVGKEESKDVGAADGDKDGDSSDKGSLHDSADDESDLSDVPDPDDPEVNMTFPNLAPPRKTESPNRQWEADQAAPGAAPEAEEI